VNVISRAAIFGLALFAAALSSASFAQGLLDPTRPPPAVLAMAPKGKPGQAALAGPDASEQENSSRLQMVTIGPAQKYAIISGRVVRIGGTIEGAKLVEVRPNSIVLQSPEGAKETVGLYQNITITKVPPETAGSSKAARGKDSAKGTKKENR
jgi:hypothetical protein